MEKEKARQRAQVEEDDGYRYEASSSSSTAPPKKSKKGSQCSVSGGNYEKEVHRVLKNVWIQTEEGLRKFHSQLERELGGSSSKNDLQCNFREECDIGIEVKRSCTPDWMQCALQYDEDTGRWSASQRGKIPTECRKFFNEHFENIQLFRGNIPPFFQRKIPYEEWERIKKEQKDIWEDAYYDISETAISDLYRKKGCQYIQIDEYGLYHTGEDVCDFKVPEFKTPQRIRVRIKVHSRTKSQLSVTAACQPTDIRKLSKSPFSLDDMGKLPKNLIDKS